MAIALERLKKEEAAALRVESELQVARSVQEYLYPRVVPPLRGATVSGRTLAARMIGGTQSISGNSMNVTVQPGTTSMLVVGIQSSIDASN